MCAISACTEQTSTAPEVLKVARSSDVSFTNKFIAWSEFPNSSPIRMQLFTLDARQERQFADWADERVVAFARANPGRLYINGDEPDQYCVKPMDYAVWYHDFVEGVRAADPTARFSPSGFAEPNYKCCPLPDDVPAPCWYESHSIGFAQQFYNAYLERYKVPPPVDEWRFHDFGLRYGLGDVAGWWSRIDQLAQWSVDHGAKMVLGSFGFMGWREPESDYSEHLKQAMARIMNDDRINGAVYWSYQQWLGNPHYLANSDETLTEVGRTYSNPLTDVPNGLTLIGDTASGEAKLRWNNTTNAWAAEVEFWSQAKGASSFVYKGTDRTGGLGGTESAWNSFADGESVKARVRYYNPYGQAGWSEFSNPVLIKADEEANAKGSSWKGAVFCFISKRIQSTPCA